ARTGDPDPPLQTCARGSQRIYKSVDHMAERRVFGHAPGVPVGRVFADRQSLSDARVHGPTMGGIWGTPSEGASSIVMSGGYEDDIDQGDLIVYTGHGGNDQLPSGRSLTRNSPR